MKKRFKSLLLLLFILIFSISQAQDVAKKTQDSFINFVNSIDKERIEIPVQFYPKLNIDTSLYFPQSPFYSLMETKPSNNNEVLGIYKVRDCTPITCLWEIRVYLIKSGQIADNQKFEDTFQTTPEISFIHEAFLVLSEEVMDFEENEAGAMEETGNSYKKTVIITILEDKIAALDQLSNEQLRICRNQIFARYGRKFKSEDLQKHFSLYDWYSPVYDNVDDKLTLIDKEIIEHILALENN